MSNELKTACMNFYDSWHGVSVNPEERQEFAGILLNFVTLWQKAATAAADAEWRGVVEALEYVEANYDGMNKAAIVRQALAQAEKFMGRKP